MVQCLQSTTMHASPNGERRRLHRSIDSALERRCRSRVLRTISLSLDEDFTRVSSFESPETLVHGPRVWT